MVCIFDSGGLPTTPDDSEFTKRVSDREENFPFIFFTFLPNPLRTCYRIFALLALSRLLLRFKLRDADRIDYRSDDLVRA